MKVAWVPREPPLSACGLVVVASGIARLLRLEDEALGRLQGVVGAGKIVILGDGEALPWVDGATWLGVDPEARALRLPTTLRPDVPVAWLERRVLALAAGSGGGPFVVLPETQEIIPLGSALPLDRAMIEQMAKGA